MLDFTTVLEFSHTHCVAICAVLVPLNLLTTLQTIVLVGLNQPTLRVWLAAGLASFSALVMVLHVLTWFVIGVVMLPTYVLLSLGGVCLGVNLWAIAHPRSMNGLIMLVGRSLRSLRVHTEPSL